MEIWTGYSLQSSVLAAMSQFELKILHYATLPSTNTEAARLALAGASEGHCVLADEQTAGRGRLLREWISPNDAGLYFSMILRPSLPLERWPLITLMAALAVQAALAEAANLETDIKWPNDLLANDRKLCGILTETVETKLGRALVVGIGINLTAEAFPPKLLETATSVQSATGRAVARKIILDALVNALRQRYLSLQVTGGEEEVIRDWCNRSSYAYGKRIRVSDQTEFIEGVTNGLAADGALRLETDDGRVRIIRAGDISSLRSSA
jgi:BirA family biotin operon repressor/biotin-[acetyl-CoA-carboxylase] ligase